MEHCPGVALRELLCCRAPHRWQRVQQWRACAIGALPCVFDPNGAVPPCTLPPADADDGPTHPPPTVAADGGGAAEAAGRTHAACAEGLPKRAQTAADAVPAPRGGELAAPAASASRVCEASAAAVPAQDADAEDASRPEECVLGTVTLW